MEKKVNHSRRAIGWIGLSCLLSACAADPNPGEALSRRGEEISAAGRLFHVGTRVVLWNDPGGYDAYRPHCFFDPDRVGPSAAPHRVARYGSLRGDLEPEILERVGKQGWTIEDARLAIRQIVVHYDACGTSRQCFKVLHDDRGLSCHFLLDLDGTVYQTLDLKERAWHAGIANDHSIGIEIAHPGAYSSAERLKGWYRVDERGVAITLPKSLGDGGLPPGFVGRPARAELIQGAIHGRDLVQHDFTEEQYVALEKLVVALCRVFPGVRPRVPRRGDGALNTGLIEPEGSGAAAWEGVIGHWHVTTGKVDPGPAFDWERIERALRAAGLRDRGPSRSVSS